MATRFYPKDPQTKTSVTFDFTSILETGATINSVVITPTVLLGSDPTPANVMDGAATIQSPKVLQPVKGGIDGVEYNLKCVATTTLATVHVIDGVLPVVDEAIIRPGAYPSETALTTVDALKQWLNPGPPGTTSDEMLLALIARVSATIVQATNIPTIFDTGSNRTEMRNGNGKDRILVQVPPIISVASVTVYQALGVNIGTLQPTVIPLSVNGANSGYTFDDKFIYLVGGYCFTSGRQNIALVYRGGYQLKSSVQAMLEQAALVSAALWWNRRSHVDQVSIAAPQGMGTIAFTQKDLPPEAWSIINQVRRVAPIAP